MKFLNLILTTSTLLLLHSTHILAAFRPDLRENVQVAELEPDQRVAAGATEIPLKAYPGSDFEILFKCVDDSRQFTFADDKRFVACCSPGQQLLGSEATAFDCCNVGEELVGCADTGYQCCPAGMSYEECTGTYKPKTCPDSEILVNSQCLCPLGTYRTPAGVCEALQCSSGIQSGEFRLKRTTTRLADTDAGKCYTFTFENGFRFGYNSAGFYTASEESRAQQFGKFQVCSSECCSFDTEINPGQPFYIKDLHGSANGGLDAKQWLNNAKDGSHISKTPQFSQAGVFTISKWPCGKYCLSGLESGVGPTCPTEMLGATFTTADDQSCIPLTLLEVPCDIRSLANNCIWETDAAPCSKKAEVPTCNVQINATGSVPIPVPVSVTTEIDQQIVI
jgi:hypothetical protein